VGAGTVLNAAQLDQAVNAGAQFIVSPGSTPALLDRAAETGTWLIPGVATASEVLLALERGLTLLKLFPAAALGGPAAVKALAGPFPDVRFVPTGGISAANLADYLSLPAVSAVGGSWMVPRSAIARQDFATVERLAAEANQLAKDILARKES
jgi:2-dehydro-3-deoxyphosphogluconate aldolase/(4S)-4-hydroxy-2-oxoglutarate aldolase